MKERGIKLWGYQCGDLEDTAIIVSNSANVMWAATLALPTPLRKSSVDIQVFKSLCKTGVVKVEGVGGAVTVEGCRQSFDTVMKYLAALIICKQAISLCDSLMFHLRSDIPSRQFSCRFLCPSAACYAGYLPRVSLSYNVQWIEGAPLLLHMTWFILFSKMNMKSIISSGLKARIGFLCNFPCTFWSWSLFYICPLILIHPLFHLAI